MSSITDLQAALVLKAADISNEIDRLECLATIDEWAAARTAIAALQSARTASYSIAGRSVTRRDIPNIQITERQLYQRIQESLYCRGSGLADMRGSGVDNP